MAWALWLALWVLGGPGARGCLRCDPGSMRLLRELKGPYLGRQLRGEPGLRARLEALLERSLQGLAELPIGEQSYMGVIDEKTMGEAAAHFRRAVTRIMENDFKVYCPNKCGRMVHQFIDCRACGTKIYSCNRDLRCGERRLQVQQDDDLILDCALTWHRASYGAKSYRFYRAVGGSEQVMVTGPDAFLVKKEAAANDSGRYRCEMLNTQGWVCSELRFQVTVTPLPGNSTPPPAPPLLGPLTLPPPSRSPTPPGGPGDWTVWVIIGSSAGLVLLLIGGCTWLYRRQQEVPEKDGGSQEGQLKT
ncbi:izumo sperm-egg fusion protein 1 isoform X4 [Mauremys reevesii]|uniref:izumo sperm-egg fusion protein 1 isoform X4 n=1 Tax=Mauremys reevesii TaxID=260615 RepID=UPI00193F9D7B|nr:izumo sperm-egg fusion protein 1 isoform X4 [Mauremys reevesii]